VFDKEIIEVKVEGIKSLLATIIVKDLNVVKELVRKRYL
jgi:hypothetical protein